MCIGVNNSQAANTKVYVGKGQRNGQDVHVLAYSADLDSLDPSGKGAMLLPIPSDSPLTEDNFIDTSDFSDFLEDITQASKVHSRMLLGDNTRSFSLSLSDDDALVVDRGDVTYVYAASFAGVVIALGRVREDRRPTFTQAFIDGCTALYNNPIAIACWAGSAKMQPLMVWYVPSDSEIFRLPTMDSHDGAAPRQIKVDTDHNLSVSAGEKNGYVVKYSDLIPGNVRGLLPARVHGTKFEYKMDNGDCFVNVDDSINKRFPHILRKWSRDAAPTSQTRMLGWG